MVKNTTLPRDEGLKYLVVGSTQRINLAIPTKQSLKRLQTKSGIRPANCLKARAS